MSYRATCPACGSVFRISDAQLDVARGWAQCGVCGEIFDTRPTLIADAAALPDSQRPHAVVEIAQPPRPPLPPIEIFDPHPDSHHAPTHPPRPRRHKRTHFTATPPAPTSLAAPTGPAPTNTAVPPVIRPRPQARTHWGVLAAMLAPLLLVQLVWFLRDNLVDHWPESRPAIVAACAKLGCSVSLPRRLDALTVVGSDLSRARGKERYTLDLTLGNQSAFDLAWPLLVVTLTDEASKPYARRSFAPSEYLDDARLREPGVAARKETPVELALQVRGEAPAGYQVSLAY